MPIPVALLISATRTAHSLSLRRVAKDLGMPFSTLAACENFLYSLPPSIAGPLARLFYSYPPPPQLFEFPPDEHALSFMCHRDALFRALIPSLEPSYHGRRSAYAVGSLFLAITDIFCEHEGTTLRVRAPHDSVAAWALEYLFAYWWASTRKQDAFGLRYSLLPREKSYVASFEFRGGSTYDVFFPEKRGHDCYFAYLFLYILLKRIVFSFSPALERLASHSVIAARGPLQIAAQTKGLLSAKEAAEVLRQAWSPPLAVADALVVYGPQSDITLLTSSLADPAAYWIALKGDLLAEAGGADSETS